MAEGAPRKYPRPGAICRGAAVRGPCAFPARCPRGFPSATPSRLLVGAGEVILAPSGIRSFQSRARILCREGKEGKGKGTPGMWVVRSCASFILDLLFARSRDGADAQSPGAPAQHESEPVPSARLRKPLYSVALPPRMILLFGSLGVRPSGRGSGRRGRSEGLALWRVGAVEGLQQPRAAGDLRLRGLPCKKPAHPESSCCCGPRGPAPPHSQCPIVAGIEGRPFSRRHKLSPLRSTASFPRSSTHFICLVHLSLSLRSDLQSNATGVPADQAPSPLAFRQEFSLEISSHVVSAALASAFQRT